MAQAFAAGGHRYALAVASYTQLMTAQQLVQQTHIELMAAQSQRLIDSVALYQAMAGGHAGANENVSRE